MMLMQLFEKTVTANLKMLSRNLSGTKTKSE
jgi:hypothetical protein